MRPLLEVRPATDELPTPAGYELSRWERGTLPFENIAGMAAAVDYIASLGDVAPSGGGISGGDRRARLTAAFAAIEAHEAALSARFLTGLEATVPELMVWGEQGVAGRCPTFALTGRHVTSATATAGGAVELSPEELSASLSREGIMATYGNFYAVEVRACTACVRRCGVCVDGISQAHPKAAPRVAPALLPPVSLLHSSC